MIRKREDVSVLGSELHSDLLFKIWSGSVPGWVSEAKAF